MLTKSALEVTNMNITEYRRYHVAFMANNSGSTFLHTLLSIFFTVQCSVICSIGNKHLAWLQYIHEYVFMVLPLIAAHTVLARHIYLLNCIAFAILMSKLIRHSSEFHSSFMQLNRFHNRKTYSISTMRALTYLITVFSILAVDFKVFPRHLAKTERYGYSFMDTGVGLFILMSGLVHKDVNRRNYVSIIKSNTKLISILVFLGVARYATVKQFDYHEHITEYGVHWNFFFTLAICKLISSILLIFSKHALLLSITTLVSHELILYNGLEDWVFSDIPRTSLIEANREGIMSTLGYVSLYLFAVHIKYELGDTTTRRYKVLCKFVLSFLILGFLAVLINVYRPTSRTLANTGYCLYLECILVTILTILYVVEVLLQDTKLYFNLPKILSSINSSGLIYFLLANLMTGFINLTFRTLELSEKISFIILNIYMSLTLVLAIILERVV